MSVKLILPYNIGLACSSFENFPPSSTCLSGSIPAVQHWRCLFIFKRKLEIFFLHCVFVRVSLLPLRAANDV